MNAAPTLRVTVRQAIEEDIASILPLWRELIEFHSDFDSKFRLAAEVGSAGKSHLRSELHRSNSFLAVAEHDSGIVGYCLASVHQHPAFFKRRAYGFVSEFHVSQSFRRLGIGTSLFTSMKEWFKRQRVSRIELVTMNANDRSKAFWQRMGCGAFAERRCLELGA